MEIIYTPDALADLKKNQKKVETMPLKRG